MPEPAPPALPPMRRHGPKSRGDRSSGSDRRALIGRHLAVPVLAAQNDSTSIRAAVDALADALLAAVRAEVTPTPDAPDRLLSISDTCAALGGVSRTTVYALFASGALTSCRVGRRRLVPAGAITRYIGATANVSVPAGPSARPKAQP